MEGPNFFFWGRGVSFDILFGGFGVLTMFPIMPSMFSSCSHVFLNLFPIVSHSKEYIKDVFLNAQKVRQEPSVWAKHEALFKSQGKVNTMEKEARVKLGNAPIPKFHPSRFLCINVWQ